jgi:2-polyprenyl-3-methyl-5-hydroxy-6-metoxy-1,4-benzoquinol methylase
VKLQEVYWQVVERRASFPGAPLIKIRPDWREQSPPSGPAADLFKRHLAGAQTILDVGAGDRYWKEVLERLGLDLSYQSADVESRHDHDFRDFFEVRTSFDAILMLELLEHLPVEVGLRFLGHAITLLRPGGVLVVGTPNPAHAHWVWSADFTHIRPWPARDIWAILLIAGLEDVEVYRQMLTNPRRLLTMPFQSVLSRLLELDPAQGLLAFGRKPSVTGEDGPTH